MVSRKKSTKFSLGLDEKVFLASMRLPEAAREDEGAAKCVVSAASRRALLGEAHIVIWCPSVRLWVATKLHCAKTARVEPWNFVHTGSDVTSYFRSPTNYYYYYYLADRLSGYRTLKAPALSQFGFNCGSLTLKIGSKYATGLK